MEIISNPSDKITDKLSDNALLALLLSTSRVHYNSLQQAAAMMNTCQNRLEKLYSMPVGDMPVALGITLNDSVRLKAAFELARRRQVELVLDKPKISCSNDAYRLFDSLSDNPYEEFHIIVLNKANRVIGCRKISEGGISGTVVDLKRIFHETLVMMGVSLILVHNHPSGNLCPSEADITVTNKIVNAGKMLDIAILDHVIIGCGQFYSFADDGQI
jgi:DNA repair protein RadC